MQLVQVRLTDPLVAPLLAGLAAEYELRYGLVEELVDAVPHEFDAPAGVFIVLVDDDQTVAGGGIRHLEADTCEVKRLWTSPQYRRRGYASMVLTALEDTARGRGYTRVRLWTGPLQPEAVAFYRHFGYRMIRSYGLDNQEAVAFERHLDPIER